LKGARESEMLILSRHENEEILIGLGEDCVRVMVVDIRQNAVRLGITAPEHVPIIRRELKRREPRPESQEPESWVEARTPD
jgi:carbon storage regulator CsrA